MLQGRSFGGLRWIGLCGRGILWFVTAYGFWVLWFVTALMWLVTDEVCHVVWVLWFVTALMGYVLSYGFCGLSRRSCGGPSSVVLAFLVDERATFSFATSWWMSCCSL